MAQYSPLLRQQKVALFALIAASASFAVGVMLPVNLRMDRSTQQSLSVKSLPHQRIVPNISEKP
ncbi:MAG: hypothetical protein ACKPEN_10020, partial [Planktothrix sp.]